MRSGVIAIPTQAEAQNYCGPPLVRLERLALKHSLSGWDVLVLTGYSEQKQAINQGTCETSIQSLDCPGATR